MTFKFNMKQHISNTVFYGKDGYQQLQRILDHTKPSKVFILTDQKHSTTLRSKAIDSSESYNRSGDAANTQRRTI